MYKGMLATDFPIIVIELYNRYFLKFDTVSSESAGTL